MAYVLIAVICAAGAGMLWLMRRDVRAQGAAEEETKSQEENADDVRTAQIVRDRFVRDADYAQRVRERFERKE